MKPLPRFSGKGILFANVSQRFLPWLLLIGGAYESLRLAGLETRDTADLEVCATSVAAPLRCVFWGLERVAGIEPA